MDAEFVQSIKDLIPQYFNVKKAFLHYYHMGINHDEKYLDKRGMELKRFLYYLRAMLACQWIAERGTPPPVLFRELVAATVSKPDILQEIENILQLKSQSKEHDKSLVPLSLMNFGSNLQEKVEEQLQIFSAMPPTKVDYTALNQLMVRMTAW